VRAAARLSGRSERDLIERLVEGTSYSCSPGDPESEEDLNLEGLGKIEKKLSEVSKEIAGKRDLRRLFARARELGIGLDSNDDFVQPAGRVERYASFQKRVLPELIRTDDLPPRPSVPLGEIRAGDIPCMIRLYPDENWGPKGPALMERLEAAGLGDVEIKGVAGPVVSSWLEIVPLETGDAVAPVLRLTSRTVFKTAEACSKFAPFAGEVFNDGETIYSEGGPLEDADLPYGHSITTASDARTESFVTYYTEVSLEPHAHKAYLKSVRTLIPLDHSLVGRFDDRVRAYLLNPAVTEGLSATNRRYCAATAEKMVELGLEDAETLTLFPGGTMAALLYRSLFDAPAPARLDQLLDESARVLVGKLDAIIDDLRG
jgi:hypothetical protein